MLRANIAAWALSGAALAALIGISADSAQAQRACPSRAVQASFVLWPQNSLGIGQVVVGTHPCGRRLRCEAGARGRQAGFVTHPRRCRWL